MEGIPPTSEKFIKLWIIPQKLKRYIRPQTLVYESSILYYGKLFKASTNFSLKKEKKKKKNNKQTNKMNSFCLSL